MRAIFISLVVVNVCLLAWGMVFSTGPVAEVKRSQSMVDLTGVSSLKLLSELESLKTLAEVAEERVVVAPQPESSASAAGSLEGEQVDADVTEGSTSKALCEMVGNFRDSKSAGNFVERLQAIDVRGELKEMELPAGPGYWVYLSPVASRRDALRRLAELQSKGIDSYVIPKGDLANGISLGMFSQKTLADSRLTEMKRAGLDPKLEVIERTYRELWVMLEAGEHKKMSEITWKRVLEGFNSLERRQNFCLDVAFSENIL